MTGKKLLAREEYLKQFSRAVRWRLGAAEAEEPIADYRELVFQEERDPAKLTEELGAPEQAARLLTNGKGYRQWLVVFGVLMFGLLLQAKWSWVGVVFVRLIPLREWWYPVLAMMVDLPLALVWFRRCGKKSGPLPRPLLGALAAVLAAVAGILAIIYAAASFGVVAQDPNGAWEFERHMRMAILAIMLTGILFAAAGTAGLILARCRDRRWLALYTLCVTVGAVLGFTLFCLLRTNINAGIKPIFLFYLPTRLLEIVILGLIGTGVALC